MGCNCECHDKLNALGIHGCCFGCEKEHDSLRNALSALEIISKRRPSSYEPDQEHQEWGNFDDSYSYGMDTAYTRAADIADAALKETGK